jgi:hypothetical protein
LLAESKQGLQGMEGGTVTAFQEKKNKNFCKTH